MDQDTSGHVCPLLKSNMEGGQMMRVQDCDKIQGDPPKCYKVIAVSSVCKTTMWVSDPKSR